MKYYIVNLIIAILPISRWFGFKRVLLRFCGASISENVRVMRIRVQGVNLKVDSNTFIGDDTLIMGAEGTNVVIGKNCDISSRVSIVTGTHHVGSLEQAAGKGYGEDIIIEDGVWVGFGATILHGVTIGKGSIIAAGSVVVANVPENVLVVGVPAKIKKTLYVSND